VRVRWNRLITNSLATKSFVLVVRGATGATLGVSLGVSLATVTHWSHLVRVMLSGLVQDISQQSGFLLVFGLLVSGRTAQTVAFPHTIYHP